MISTEMIKKLDACKDLVTLAVEDRAQGNYFGAGCLVRQYEQLVEEELNFWRVDWAYAYSLGLILDVSEFY